MRKGFRKLFWEVAGMAKEQTFELVNYMVEDRIAWIMLNNAERMNALSTGIQNGLWYAFEEAINDDDVWWLPLREAGRFALEPISRK